jgi:hypothetical protein
MARVILQELSRVVNHSGNGLLDKIGIGEHLPLQVLSNPSEKEIAIFRYFTVRQKIGSEVLECLSQSMILSESQNHPVKEGTEELAIRMQLVKRHVRQSDLKTIEHLPREHPRKWCGQKARTELH